MKNWEKLTIFFVLQNLSAKVVGDKRGAVAI